MKKAKRVKKIVEDSDNMVKAVEVMLEEGLCITGAEGRRYYNLLKDKK